jgi:beta-phosphoglucomutase-like phosphatase (HAD superfamily)
MLVESVTISRRDFDAAIFDLDGVLTDTARVHAAAWKAVFDAFLQRWAQQRGLAFQPLYIEADYLDHVDGRPRDDGIRSFLAARGINLPEGSEHDPEDANTVHALGERKTRLFLQALQKGIDPAAGAEALLNKLRGVGVRTAVGSSSKKEARAAILEFVRRNASDQIALAWRGSLEPERAQTIRRVIRDASCPVIVFRVQA